MNFKLVFLMVMFFSSALHAQEVPCENRFKTDTITIFSDEKLLEGEMLKTVLKNQSEVQVFAINKSKFYVRIYITENFYFNKVDNLFIESGSWNYPVKNCKQFKITKTMGMYAFEVQKNYLATLRDNGMTGLVFAGAETDFTKSDTQHLKKMFQCFYETMFGKK